ncbi:phage tail protein [Edwardsiella tarda]
MSAKYFAILTNLGAAKMANATALGTKLNVTHMAVGDGGGSLQTPDPGQTALRGERRRAALNMLSVDPNNASQIIAEQVIPENEGGWWIREIGLYDSNGVLIAVANCPETYKPQLQEGSGRTQTIRMVLIVSSTEAVTLKIDPSVVLATREYVDSKLDEHARSRNHPDATLLAKGFVQLSSDDNSDVEDKAATPAAVRKVRGFVEREIGKLVGSLGDGSALPVGIPVPWSSDTPPAGWIKCNGAPFDKAKYPKLALAYPSGRLPDLRAEFIRGADDGRGIDEGRRVLTTQGDAIRDITGTISNVYMSRTDVVGVGALRTKKNTAASARAVDQTVISDWDGFDFAASRVVPTANENRPRNVSFIYIVRAA